MITANELRIGNIVSDSGGMPYIIDATDIIALESSEDRGKVNLDYNALTLTEEWLLKFDFKEISPGLYNNSGIHVYLNGEVPQPFLKSVHQLQNLFYALCGKELNIKP